ncbi:hypothetical protein H072_2720 [Dactylellina haptotyla CBS 200.50]|uniref:S5 DRBM domain-containing protein n=1 Tax=Dactylellina haptotyla (strain CBS 200.50) TaxID=1284197 RepID=S8AK42_DACHA|nr:hypothetical protein H072_2720 [Dactylellina haptotyla CBS 200.50]
MSCLAKNKSIVRALASASGFKRISIDGRFFHSSLSLSKGHYLSTFKNSRTSTDDVQSYYEQEQLAALADVENHISETVHGGWKPRRRDAFSLPYFTDLSRIDPFLDKPVSGIPKSGRWPSQPVPQMENVQFKQGEEDDENKLKDLSRLTGLPISYLETLKVRELVSHRVTNQTRLGKIPKQYVLTVAGDGNGMIGIGEASSTAAELSSRMSQYQAIKNLRPIIRYEDRTIYGNVKVKIGAVELQLMSRPPGKTTNILY